IRGFHVTGVQTCALPICIISGVGQITESNALGNAAHHGRRLSIQAPAGFLDDVGLGDSIALNGACMTVTSFDPATARFTIDVSRSEDRRAGEPRRRLTAL